MAEFLTSGRTAQSIDLYRIASYLSLKWSGGGEEGEALRHRGISHYRVKFWSRQVILGSYPRTFN